MLQSCAMDFSEDNLNAEQLAAIHFPKGAQLIVAGPGSGKTRVITHRLAWLVESGLVQPWEMLAVTFTNKAAKEMRVRVQSLLNEKTVGLQIGTFHAMCARWLSAYGEAIGISSNYSIYDADDQLSLMKRVIENLNLDKKRFARPVLSAVSRAKNDGLTHVTFKGNVEKDLSSSYFQEVVARAYGDYQNALQQVPALDFDDLLLEAARLLDQDLETRERLANRYKHVLVDEFQDTNSLQYRIARSLASIHGNICVVGDPDQNIYTWRSADPENLNTFLTDFPEATTFLLNQNYRSTQQILDAASNLISHNKNHVERKLWTDRSGGELINLYVARNDDDEGRFVVKEIQRLLASGKTLADIAILYRTNAQSRAFEEALNRFRIPYRIVGGIRFYQRREVKDLIAYLRLVNNILDEAALLRIINVPSRGIGRTTISRLREIADVREISVWEACELVVQQKTKEISERSTNAILRFVNLINNLRECVPDLEPPQLLEKIIEDSNYAKALNEKAAPELQDQLDNLQELLSVLTSYSERSDDFWDEDIESQDVVTPLMQFLNDVALVADSDEIESDASAITLMTLHTAKGLEFGTVFIVGMEEGLLPHSRSLEMGDYTAIEEERRLAYVGLTRAKDLLYLTYASHRYRQFTSGQPSRFLNEVGLSSLKQVNDVHISIPSTKIERDAPVRDADKVAITAAWKPGDRVRHPNFGAGLVIEVRERHDDMEIAVAFESKGVRRLLQSYAPLEADIS